MKNELNEAIGNIFASKIDKLTAKEFQKLIAFIDASLSRGYTLPNEEKTEYLFKQFLNMRDFLSSSVVVENFSSATSKQVIEAVDLTVLKYDYSKKKEESSIGEFNQNQEYGLENTLEKDQNTVLEEEV